MNILKRPPSLATHARIRVLCKAEDVDVSLLAFIHPAGNASGRKEEEGTGCEYEVDAGVRPLSFD